MSLRGLMLGASIGLASIVGCVTAGESIKYELPPVVEETVNASYDNSNHLVTDEGIDEMVSSTYKVVLDFTLKEVITDYETGAVISDQERSARGHGSGLLVDNEDVDTDNIYHCLTCAHVVNGLEGGEEEGYIWGANGPVHVRVTYEVLDNECYIDLDGGKIPFKVLATSESLDVALLKIDTEKDLEVFNGGFADPGRVNYGDFAYVVGFPLDMGKLLSQGIISHPDGTTEGAEEGESYHDFFLSTPAVNPGNSGGPLYLLDEGEPVFAGMAQFKYRGVDGVYGFVRIDEIRDFLVGHAMGDLIR